MFKKVDQIKLRKDVIVKEVETINKVELLLTQTNFYFKIQFLLLWLTDIV